jgi:uncharacterized protein (TIGR02246 family)
MRYTVIATSLLMLGLAVGTATAARKGVRKGAAAGARKRPAASALKAAAPERDADEKGVRQSAEAFKEAFTKNDAAAVAALWLPDGEYVDESGTAISGRAEIQKRYEAFFKEHPKAHMQVWIDSIRFLGPNLAFEEGTTRLIEPPIGATSSGHYTVLYSKQDGNWMMASVRDLESKDISKYDDLKVLEPLIGKWTVTNGDARVEMDVDWVENRSFLRRIYHTYRGNELISNGLEIIGIDPEIGEISSWQFVDDGALGQNVWRPDGKGWRIEAKGTTADGKPTAAVNVLTPTDNDTFTWHSINRSLDGQPVQDMPPMKITRKR